MKPVIQEETTGCAIASSAALAGISYKKAKKIANELGIFAQDSALWSQTTYIRTLLKQLGMLADKVETPFKTWEELPDCALLAIKWHIEDRQPYWHWVVFIRENGNSYVLDSKKLLKSHIRTDFGRIKPKWYIEIKKNSGKNFSAN